jgi:hypothetical protein
MKWILTAFVTIIAICSCNRSQDIPAIRSAYYWSTAFSIDSTKRQFLKSHDIRKIYLRYFDVVVDASGQLTPNATVRFDSKMPNGTETVPTVYIVNECMYQISRKNIKKDIADERHKRHPWRERNTD